MERFDEATKAEFPEHNTPGDIEACLDLLHKLKVDKCDGIGLSPVSKVPAQMMILTQVGLRRTIELTETAIREINRRNLVASALVARSTLETSCLLWDVMYKVDELVQSNDVAAMKDFHELMSRSLFGGKAKEKNIRIIEDVESRNVITIIEKLSKKLDAPLMGFFERLSEFSHPNYHGMMATYTVEGAEGSVKQFCDRRKGTEKVLILTALGTVSTSCGIVVRVFEMLAANLKGLACLAEREVYERGAWPKNEPYPVNRT